MKIIDILNKIANGEDVPKKIMYKGEEYVWNYIDETYYCCDHDRTDLLNSFVLTDILNDEVEILEITLNTKDMNITTPSRKIEKLEIIQEKNCKNNWKWKCNGYNISTPQKIIADKVNEIIGKLNGE